MEHVAQIVNTGHYGLFSNELLVTFFTTELLQVQNLLKTYSCKGKSCKIPISCCLSMAFWWEFIFKTRNLFSKRKELLKYPKKTSQKNWLYGMIT